MKLSQILPASLIVRQAADPEPEIPAITYDSRRVEPGALFFALPGFKADGHSYAAAARARGAGAIVTERWLAGLGLPQVQVHDARLAMAAASANFYGRPSGRLRVTGITGTNGKTTTTFLLDSILQAAGNLTGLIGGVECRIAGRVAPAARTTPESPDLQRALAEMVAAGAGFATLEVSSHGIELKRSACVAFDVAVFTNLTRDHLDLHQDMETYFLTKRKLFIWEESQTCPGQEITRPQAAICLDGEYGRRLYRELAGEALGFGWANDASVTALDIREIDRGYTFELVTPDGSAPARLQLPGRHNLDNAMAAAAAACQLGVPLQSITAGIGRLTRVPGRFDFIDAGVPFTVVVDYAHNEDGLERALAAARRMTERKLILVFGCPGERDRDKRPGMGRIAGTMADLAILTTDDCYQEPAGQILDETEPGLAESGGNYLRIEDRREAIETALKSAGDGDLVLIAGKGHETKQMLAAGPVPFSDSAVVKEILG